MDQNEITDDSKLQMTKNYKWQMTHDKNLNMTNEILPKMIQNMQNDK